MGIEQISPLKETKQSMSLVSMATDTVASSVLQKIYALILRTMLNI